MVSISMSIVAMTALLACSDPGGIGADDAGVNGNGDAGGCDPGLWCDGLVVMDRRADCSEVEVETCAADTQRCVENGCLWMTGQPCDEDAACVSGRCAGPVLNTTCTEGSEGQSCDDELDCVAAAPLCLEGRCEVCAQDCSGYACGTDCRGDCAPGCAAGDVCDVAADFVEDHGASLDAVIGDLGLLVPVPPLSQSIGAGLIVDLCPDGGCYLWVELDASPLAVSGWNRVDLVAQVTFWSADLNGDPAALPYEIDTTLGTVDCEASVDTRLAGAPSNTLISTLVSTNTPQTNALYYQGPVDTDLLDVDPDDFPISGNMLCDTDSWLVGLVRSTISQAVAEALDLSSRAQVCALCSDPTECPADATCDGGYCLRDGACLAPGLGGVCVTP